MVCQNVISCSSSLSDIKYKIVYSITDERLFVQMKNLYEERICPFGNFDAPVHRFTEQT